MKCLVLLVMTVFSISAFAEKNYDLARRFGVGGGLGTSIITAPDRQKDAFDEGLVGSLWLRYHYNSQWGVELEYNRLNFEFKDSAFDDFDPVADVVDVALSYRFNAEKRLHYLLQAGVGFIHFTDGNPARDTFDDLAVKGKVGAEYMATQDLAVALHGDYYYANLGSGGGSSLHAFAPMLALTYYFGGKKSEAAPAAPAATGPVDSDGDGVVDADDKCAATPAGQKVNEFGCAKEEKLEFTLNVQFATGSTKVDEKFTSDLAKLAEFMTKYPAVNAEIEGHTDNTGSEKFNFTISQKRAEAVRQYLIKNLKIDKSRLTAKGYGPSQPVSDNTTPEGRTKNRRVVAHVQTASK